MERDYHDPTLPNIGGMTLDGSLIWQATALTTAKLTAASAVSESILQGVSGAFSRDFNIQVDHAFRTWLIGTVQAGYGNDDYLGLSREDNRYFVSGGLTYKMNREMQLKGEVRHDWLTSKPARQCLRGDLRVVARCGRWQREVTAVEFAEDFPDLGAETRRDVGPLERVGRHWRRESRSSSRNRSCGRRTAGRRTAGSCASWIMASVSWISPPAPRSWVPRTPRISGCRM